MNDMNTPNPLEQQPGVRFELDATLPDAYLCDSNRPGYRPSVATYIEAKTGRIAEITIEAPFAAA